jgi:hypothetical protein
MQSIQLLATNVMRICCKGPVGVTAQALSFVVLVQCGRTRRRQLIEHDERVTETETPNCAPAWDWLALKKGNPMQSRSSRLDEMATP